MLPHEITSFCEWLNQFSSDVQYSMSHRIHRLVAVYPELLDQGVSWDQLSNMTEE